MIILKALSYKLVKTYFLVLNSKVYMSLLNNYFIIVIGLILIILTKISLIYLPVLAFYMIYIYKKSKLILFIIVCLGAIYTIYSVVLDNRIVDNPTDFNAIVTSVEKKDNYNQILVKYKRQKIMVYDKEFTNLRVGDTIKVKGTEIIIEENRVWNSFNYNLYLKHNHINYVIGATEIEVTGHRFHINEIKEYVFGYFTNKFSSDSLSFLKALLLGDDGMFSSEFKETLKVNGVLHLFAISGSHISLFILLIESLCKKIRLKDDNTSYIIIGFLLVYLVITSFSPSILRAALVYFLIVFNRWFKLRLSSIDIVSIVFILLVLINPYYVYNIGFVLSFIVSFVIVICNKVFVGGYIKQTFMISLFAAIITFPLVVNINYEINLLSPITNVFYVFFVESVILPFSIVIVFLPFLQGIYAMLVNGFISSSFLMADYFVINLSFPKMSHFAIICFYAFLLLIIYLRNKRQVYVIIIMIASMVIYSNKVYFKNFEVNFLDLYYGESSVVINKGKVIVIDTGDGRNNVLTNFLKSEGIKRIDILILTHNHDDHNKETITLLDNFKINKIIVSNYDDSIYSNLSNSNRVLNIEGIKVGGVYLTIYPPIKDSLNANNNSLIVLLEFNNNSILFTGDATYEMESSYKYGKIDVLKVAHHGSNTSTSTTFLNDTDPTYAVIMTGRVKQFGFPNKALINRLDDNNIYTYRTDLNYSIKMRINQGKISFECLKEG